jgi:hypothetical protein
VRRSEPEFAILAGWFAVVSLSIFVLLAIALATR